MGGRSRSSSRSNTTSNVDNSNVQINGTEGGVVNVEGFGNRTTLINTDHEAVENAFEFGNDALDSVDNTVDEAFDFGGKAFDFGLDALQETNELGKFAINEAQELSQTALTVAGNAQTNAFAKIKELSDAFKVNTSQQTKQFILIGSAVVAVVVLLMFLRRRRA